MNYQLILYDITVLIYMLTTIFDSYYLNSDKNEKERINLGEYD